MRLVFCYVYLGLIGWLAAACKPAASELVPTAMDSTGVVGTLVAAKALMVGNRSANIVALAVDSTGNLYAADVANSLIRKITPSGEVSTFAGTGQAGYLNGPAALAQFNGLASLAFDKLGNLYVGEGFENTCVRKITPTGVVSTFAGEPFGSKSITFDPSTSPDGPDTSARFISVVALAFDSANNLFASDIGSINRYASSAIRKITPDGYVRTIAGFASPLANQGKLIGNIPAPFRFLSLAVNKANTLVGVDKLNQLLYQITPTGDMSLLLSGKPLSDPHCLVYDSSNNLLVANGQQVVQISPTGITRVLTGDNQVGFINDSLRLARFTYISALAIDTKNILYIADQGNQCIRRVRLK
ncbi:hypothetical protein BH09BAC4_BH09BAC4_00620 [soil metagenome]